MAYLQNAPIPITDGGTNTIAFANTNGTVYYNGTNLATVNPSTAGFVLTSNGAAAPSFQANTSTGSLVLIQTQTAVNQTTLNFLGIGPTYNNYMVLLTNILITSTNSYLIGQISTNGGVSYITTGYINTPIAAVTMGIAFVFSSIGNPALYGNATLFNMTSGTNFISMYEGFTPGGAGVSPNQYTGTYNTPGTIANALRFMMANGGNWSGTISIYGFAQ
jgi:hypothetical protein